VVEWLSDKIVVVLANAEKVLLEAFVKGVEDGVGRGQFEERMGNMRIIGELSKVFYTTDRPAVAELER